MTTEITLVRLPVRLSDLVDEAVERFVAQHPDERLQANRRYHDADLWMIFRHEPVGEAEPAFLTRRVTIAVYSDDADHLRFIPDIVVTRPEGRFMLQPDGSRAWVTGDLPAISTLQVRLSMQPDRVAEQEMHDHFLAKIIQALVDAWSAARKLRSHEATQLIP